MRVPTHPMPPPPVRTVRLLCCAVIGWALAGVEGVSAAAESPSLRIELTDGAVESGRLVALDGAGLEIEFDGRRRVVPVAGIRLVERADVAAAGDTRVRIDLVDGSWIDGEDVTWDGTVVALERHDGRGEIPVSKVRSIAWRGAGDGAVAPGAAWLAALPEAIESDLLVVGNASGHEFVECAVKAIGPDTITVVLDEETIPVKRSKVIGIHWLRSAPASAKGEAAGASSTAVELVGGALRARRVEWTAERLLLDGDISLPGEAVARLDWAAGRTTSLVGVAPERLEVEPWFGDLGRVPGLASFFAPRSVAAGDGFARPGLVVRPRTVAVWRLPAEARRFRASVAPVAAGKAAGASEVIVLVDDREVFRGRIDASTVDGNAGDGVPIEVDVTGGRRLGLSVGFATPSDGGCPVRFTSPAVEQ